RACRCRPAPTPHRSPRAPVNSPSASAYNVSTMRARGWVVSGILGLCVATAIAKPSTDPKPVAVDIAPLADQLVVLQDSRGGTYVVAAALESGARAWYGTGKKLHEQVIIGRSRDGAAWSLGTWAPR